MPDVLIRGLTVKTLARLKAQARGQGRSLQAEVRRVLERAAGPSLDELLESAGQWRRRLKPPRGDSAQLIREDRER